MKVAIICNFETYNNRVDDMFNYYSSKNYEITIIRASFLHMSKSNYKASNTTEVVIDVPSYKRNLSIKRIYSHLSFSKRVKEYLSCHCFDLLHVLVPPNSLCKDLTDLKNKPKIIFDVIDFWPETMPIPFIKKFKIYKKWVQMRDSYIYKGDYIITECNLFTNALKKKVPDKFVNKIKTVYFTRESINQEKISDISYEEINICYVGSMNNIIDINYIIELLTKLNSLKRINLHIIGDGEKKDNIFRLLTKNGINFSYHGKIYDMNKKKEIMSKCHFGLNIMKTNVFVGLTMKSLDYFQFGLPVINNLPADTTYLINKYSAGVNVNKNINKSVNDIVDEFNQESLKDLKKGVENLFINEFSSEILFKKMDNVMEDLNSGFD